MRIKGQQSGMIVVSVIISVSFLLLITTYILQLTVNNFKLAKDETYRINAQLAADAGLDYAITQLNEDDDWAGTVSETELHESNNVRQTFEIEVADGADETHKTITSVGRTYYPADAAEPINTRTFETTVEGLGSDTGSYSLVTGVGGLTMINNSKILAGDVFVNGGITMANSAQIGLSSAPVTVKAAHQLCPVPPDNDYPRVCNDGENGEPISIGSPTAHIYAEVRATNQTTGTRMSNTGLVANQTIEPLPLPDYDRDGQQSAVASTITSASAGCSNGTKTWAANTKITGNVTVSNTCKVTVAGNIWITGNLTISNSAQLIVSDALGDTVPVIMIDGSSGLTASNSANMVSNSNSTGFQIMTFYSTASCSPECDDVTGTDLATSRTHATISLGNSASGPETIFYARWTQLNISNSGQIGAIIAQTIRLTNTATITFGTEVPIPGSTDYVWVFRSYKQVF